jgi:predicted RNase H-like nuclease (RuvC/YqgF family)
MNIMALFSPVEKLINEHGSAAIQTTHIALLREQLSLIRDAFTNLESQNEILKSQLAESEKEKDGLNGKYKQLKDEIENWDKIASKYKKTSLGIGNIVYASMESNEPLHYICPNCYQKRKESILQPTRDDEYWFETKCLEHDCKFSLSIKRKDEYPPTLRSFDINY